MGGSQKNTKEIDGSCASEINLDSLKKCPDELPLSEEIWLAIPIEARVVIILFHDRMMSRIKHLEERVRELEARLSKNSSNSSKPPSSDSPKDLKERPKWEPTGRQQGGQKGHPGYFRGLADEGVVFEDHFPQHCIHCGSELIQEASRFIRHQVQELPFVKAETREYRLYEVDCPVCGKKSRAQLPAGVPSGCFGPRLQAVTSLLTGRYRLSKREASGLLRDAMGAEISLGSITALEQATSEALEGAVSEAAQAVKEAAVVNMDETGWRNHNDLAWLWVAVTQFLTVFVVSADRSRKTIEKMLGVDFQGIVTSDRHGAYNVFSPEQRSLCQAHLKRDYKALVDLGAEGKNIGEWALREQTRMFALWDQFSGGELSRSEMQEQMVTVTARMGKLLKRGSGSRDKKVARFCRRLLKLWPALWNFLRMEGVEPTNNAAERPLRPVVLWRKGSFGSQSNAGCRFAERILTVVETCKKQGRNILEFLVETCSASLLGRSAPSLLPNPPPS